MASRQRPEVISPDFLSKSDAAFLESLVDLLRSVAAELLGQDPDRLACRRLLDMKDEQIRSLWIFEAFKRLRVEATATKTKGVEIARELLDYLEVLDALRAGPRARGRKARKRKDPSPPQPRS